MKNFDEWNEQKKNIEQSSDTYSEPLLYPKEGEVWMSVLGKNIGFEQNGGGDNFSRPFLVIKKFNNHMFWIVPLSSKQKSLNFFYNFTDPEKTKYLQSLLK
jgi:mRNA interferase MazF